MTHPIGYSGVFLIGRSGRLLLQHRDDIPTILNPGMICPFGGGWEAGESPLEAAIREIEEETELRLRPRDLTALGQLEKRLPGGHTLTGHFFAASEIDEAALTIHEGRLIVLGLTEAKVHPKLTRATLTALTWLEQHIEGGR